MYLVNKWKLTVSNFSGRHHSPQCCSSLKGLTDIRLLWKFNESGMESFFREGIAGDWDSMSKHVCAPGVSTAQYFISIGIKSKYYDYSVVKLLPDVCLMQSVAAHFCYSFFHLVLFFSVWWTGSLFRCENTWLFFPSLSKKKTFHVKWEASLKSVLRCLTQSAKYLKDIKRWFDDSTLIWSFSYWYSRPYSFRFKGI